MASPLTESSPPPPTLLRDVIGHDDDDDDGNFIAEEEEEEEEDEEWADMSKRMSRLSMEGSDGGDADDEDDGGGDVEEEEEDDDAFEVRSDVNGASYGASDTRHLPWPPAPSSASLPGTPERSGVGGGGGSKGYASETEARWPPEGGRGGRRPPPHQYRRRERMAREVWLERAWRLRKQRRQMQEFAAVPVVVVGGGGGGGESPAAGGVAMDMEEVRACRDLGLDLPCDWTVEIPASCHALSGVDTASSGGNSPASGSWRISSPGDDPNDVKARLKVWAQAVALASASRLGS